MKKEKLIFVDYVKTISIFCIVLSHFLPTNFILRILLYSFHVPIFFFIAGVTFSPTKQPKCFFKKMIKRIIIPYILFFILTFISSLTIGRSDIKDIWQIFYMSGNLDLWNSVLWFFPCYIIVITLFYLNEKYLNKIINIVIYILFTLVTIFMFYNSSLYIFGINKVFLLYTYVYLGYHLKKSIMWLYNSKKRLLYISSLVFFIIIIVIYGLINKENSTSINLNDINNPQIYLIFSTLECFLLTIFCMSFEENKMIDLISKNTLFIMSTHLFFRLIAYKLNFNSIALVIYGIFIFVLEVFFLNICSNIKSQKIKRIASNFGILLK